MRLNCSGAKDGDMEALQQFFSGRGMRVHLAKELGITPGAISQWAQVPADRVLDVERITGVSRHRLRPDVFGPAPVSSTQDAAA